MRLNNYPKYASINLHVHLYLGCNLCPTGVSKFEVGMVTKRECCEHLL